VATDEGLHTHNILLHNPHHATRSLEAITYYSMSVFMVRGNSSLAVLTVKVCCDHRQYTGCHLLQTTVYTVG